MQSTFTSAARIAAIALLVTVITQITYITISNGGGTPPRDILWGIETITFALTAIAGLALLLARPIIGAGIAVSGIFNTIQAGMGLVMFGPLMEGGEALAPVFGAVLSMAFLLYFAAKIALGIAAIGAAGVLWVSGRFAKAIGALAGLAGLIAVAINAAAIFPATDLTFPAGGAGTAAAALLAIALFFVKRPDAE
ncbi:hypothetical protein [Aurantiacibacter sediminis]|uniref:Thiamine biosynthesis protein ThiC n=1 Tax=Aurantiacibacter sediminis TaxID=2793064 RepID=A0ABS0N1N0_9SPHN|nr:hypothetical protein [Aurantiacibacter sediminis]MBH5321860.1 hypothetical protein [Aurantiacibacter sediminis]